MKSVGRFEAYLLYAMAVLVFGAFVLARLQAFEGWLLVPAAGSESVIVRPAAAFSLAPLQRNVAPDALLADNPRIYRQFLDADEGYDAAQLPLHLSSAPAAEGRAFRVEPANAGPAREYTIPNGGAFRVGNWRFRMAPEQPAPGRYWVLIATRVAFTPAQLAGAGLFACGVIGFVLARWYFNRPGPPDPHLRGSRTAD